MSAKIKNNEGLCNCGCGRPVRKYKKYFSKLSAYCFTKRWRERNPTFHVYDNLRTSAKRRNIKFEISFDYFVFFLSTEPEYMKFKGQKGKDLTIDRIVEELGYIEGNLQVMTRKKNIYKYQNYVNNKTIADHEF